MPVSLRREPLGEAEAAQVRGWRAFFLATQAPTVASRAAVAEQPAGDLPGFVDTDWLAANLGRPDVRVIDCRTHADYTTAHVAGSVYLNIESFRGCVGGLPSMLLPGELLAKHLSLWGAGPDGTVVLVPGDSLRDATLIGMGLERVGQRKWAILRGGFAKWAAETRPTETAIPEIAATAYPAPGGPDNFSVDDGYIRDRLGDGHTVILDVRSTEFFVGDESTEARPGHIPGAVNRPYKEDLTEDGTLKPIAELEVAYQALISTKDTPVIVHCRTGHQASQTYFVLKYLLGYRDVSWYDAGWSEWAARPELPAQK
jgi:thiosulfate/3-mercaptopyruvate sulfurtransferase